MPLKFNATNVVAALVACSMLAGCRPAPEAGADARRDERDGRAGRQAEPPPRPPVMTLPPQYALPPGGATEVPPAGPRHFDAGTLEVGDTFLGLRVVDVAVQRVFEDSIWAGRVRFAGEIAVTGVFQQHFDYPEPEALCFHVDDAASQDRVPGFAPDVWTAANQKTWFCFTNPEQARARLGVGDPPLRATIIVDDYTVLREFSDVFDTARLVDVVRVAGPARRTLREP